MFDKNKLRNEIKIRRQALSQQQIAQYSLDFLAPAQAFFKNLPSQKIAVYLATKGELDLSASITWLWQQGHALYLPVLHENALLFCEYQESTLLVNNQYGIKEPALQNRIAATALDYVLVPLVAFDQDGHRLGMGKGYYDRTFAFRKSCNKPVLIGCGYAFQRVDALKVEAHDVNMDFILSV